MSDQSRFQPPFLHPRKDPYLKKATSTAAFLLSTAQALWLLVFVLGIMWGKELSIEMIILGILGMVLITIKSKPAGHIALGYFDYKYGLQLAPSLKDIVRRVTYELIFPATLLFLGFSSWGQTWLVWLSIAAVIIAEVLIVLGGHGQWKSHPVPPSIIVKLMRGKPEEALEILEKNVFTNPNRLELTCLAIAGVAVKDQRRDILESILEIVEKKPLEDSNTELRKAAVRVTNVVKADIARMENPETAGPAEAIALRDLPASHPRRLSLSLFVATSALESEDYESAEKALMLLHSRDVMQASPRLLANYLLLVASDTLKEKDLSDKIRESFRSFRINTHIDGLKLDRSRQLEDPYTRWVVKACTDLQDGKYKTDLDVKQNAVEHSEDTSREDS